MRIRPTSPFLRFAFLALASLSRSQTTSAPASQAEAESHAAQGLQFAQTGDLQSAEKELHQAVALAPRNPGLLVQFGTVLAMEKKLEESTTYFKQALAINPADLVARRYLAANLWQLHLFPEAKRNLEILLKQQPNDQQAILLLGMVSENMKDYATAVKMLSSVPQLVDARPESVAALARSYYHLGQNRKAQSELDQMHDPSAVLLGVQIADEARDYPTAEKMLASIEGSSIGQGTSPDQRKIGYTLALVQYHAARFDAAQATLDRLLASGYQTAELYNLLGWCRQRQNHHEDAVHAFQRAIELDPTNEANYLDLGSVLLMERRVAPALELATRAATAFPQCSRAFLLKGRAELQALHFTDAVDSFRRTLQLDPSNADATIGLASAQFSAGLKNEAHSTLESAIAHSPRKARFEAALAELLLKEAETGDETAQAKAERLLNSALSHDNSLADAYYLLGDLALRRGQNSIALQQLRTAAKLEPQSAKVHFALSRAYRRLGQNEEAAKQAALYDKLKEKETPRAPEASPDAPSSN